MNDRRSYIRRQDGTLVTLDDLPEGSGVVAESLEDLIPKIWLGFSVRQYVAEGEQTARFVTEFIPIEEQAKAICRKVGARAVKVEATISGPGLWEVKENPSGEVAGEIAESSFVAGKQIILEHAPEGV